MKKIITAAILALSCTALFAQDESEQDSAKFRFHVYPGTLLLSMLVLPSEDSVQNEDDEKFKEGKTYFTNIYFTLEQYFGNGIALTLTPSYQGWNVNKFGINDHGKLNHDRFGADLGLRHYFSGTSKGFFMEASGGIYYFKREINYFNDPYESVKYRATMYQAMLHLGVETGSGDGGVCVSAGLGINHFHDKLLRYNTESEKKGLTNSWLARRTTADFSVSIFFQ